MIETIEDCFSCLQINTYFSEKGVSLFLQSKIAILKLLQI